MQPAGSKTILLVEDDAIIALVEKRILQRNGFHVLSVNSGEKAVEMVGADSEVDLVLMDINLGPGIDGTEAAQLILRQRDVPVVFLSSHTDPAVVEKTEGITSYGYIVKNSGETVLIASIKMAFRLFDAKLRERTHEQMHRRLFETMVQGVVYQSTDGTIIDANPAAERILGLSLDQMRGRTSSDPRWKAIREDGSEYTGSDHPSMAALRTGQPVRGAVMGVYHPQCDRYVWIRINATPLYEQEDSEPHQVYTTFEDISEQREVLLALENERALMDVIFDTVPGLVFLYDENGRLARWNGQHEFLTGYTQQELSGFHFLNWFSGSEEDERVISESVARTLSQGEAQAEATIQLKDGRRAPMLFAVRSLELNGARCFAGIALDVSERNTIMQALESEKARFEYLFQNSPLAVAILDTEERVFDCNRRFEDQFGYPCEQAVGRTIDSLIVPQGMEEDARAVSQEVLWVTAPVRRETRRKRQDGSVIDVEVAGMPMRIDGKDYAYAIYQNISERKQMERELVASEKRYRQLFEAAPIPMWETDFAEAKRRLDEVENDVSGDLLRELAATVRVIDANRAALALYEIDSVEEFFTLKPQIFTEHSYEVFLEELLYISEGATRFTVEQHHLSKRGRPITIELHFSVTPDYRNSYAQVHVAGIDITEHKRAEHTLLRNEER